MATNNSNLSKEQIIARTKKSFAGPTPKQLEQQAQARARGGLTSYGIRKFQSLTPEKQKSALEKARMDTFGMKTDPTKLKTDPTKLVDSAKLQRNFIEAKRLDAEKRGILPKQTFYEKLGVFQRVSPGDISTRDKQAYRLEFKEDNANQKLQTRLTQINRQLSSGLVRKEKRQELINEAKQIEKNLGRTGRPERKPTLFEIRAKKFPYSVASILPRRLDGSLKPQSEWTIQERINLSKIPKSVYDRATSIAKQKANRVRSKTKGTKEYWAAQFGKAKTDSEKRKAVLGASIALAKEKSFDEIVNYGDKLMSKDLKFLNSVYNNIKAKNKTSSTYGSRLTERALSTVLSKPLTLSKVAIEGLIVGGAVKKGLQGVPGLVGKLGLGVKTKAVISGITKLGSTSLAGIYANQVRKGYSKAKDKNQYLVDTAVELAAFGLLTRKVPIKEAFNLKKALAELSPFYKGKFDLVKGFPQISPKGLLAKAKKTTNFYHVTNDKIKNLIKKDILEVISKKTGMGKDRIKFNEDFLFVSDKGLVSYGLKGTKPIFEYKIKGELSKILKGKFKQFKSSGILSKVKTITKANIKGNVKIRNIIDEIVLDIARKNKDIVITGQRASNLQLEKKLGRKTTDWDMKGKDPKKYVSEIFDRANKAQPGRYELKNIKTDDGIIYRIWDKKIKDYVVDMGKGTIPKTLTADGIKFAHLDYLVERKVSTLVTNLKTKRWGKDLKDLKSLLEGAGQKDKYKNAIKKFEKDILKGDFDPKQAKVTRAELKKLGFNKDAIEFLTFAKNNPLKYGALKVLMKIGSLSKPKKYSIVEFEKINVGKFPKKLIKKIEMAAEGKLSSKAQQSLRKELVSFVNSNPGKVFPGTKTLSNIAKPFGLEDEFVAAVGSKFSASKNIRSKFYSMFGVKKGEQIVFDDELNKVVQIFKVSNMAKDKSNKVLFNEFMKQLKQKYRNPKKLLSDILENQGTKTTITPEGLVRKINGLSERRKRVYGVRRLGDSNVRIGREVTPKVSLRVPKRVIPRAIKRTPPRKIQRTTTRTTQRTPTRITPRVVKRTPPRKIQRTTTRTTPRTFARVVPRVPNRIVPRKTPRIPPRTFSRKTPRTPPRTFSRKTPRTPPKSPPPEIKKRLPPIKIPPFQLEAIKKKVAQLKKKKKKVLYAYTPTLAGIGEKTKIITGKFTGFETRGNIIILKSKPIKVKQHKRVTLKNKAFVRRHRRRKPRK